MITTEPEYWKTKSLNELNSEEWEALCDGCAKCCLNRFEDADTREIHFTNVCCRYLDMEQCLCTDYPNRSINVPECVSVTQQVLKDPYWLPQTCAYRLLAEKKPLPDWHPLVSGTKTSVAASGNSICGKAISELVADDLEHHLIDWIR